MRLSVIIIIISASFSWVNFTNCSANSWGFWAALREYLIFCWSNASRICFVTTLILAVISASVEICWKTSICELNNSATRIAYDTCWRASVWIFIGKTSFSNFCISLCSCTTITGQGDWVTTFRACPPKRYCNPFFPWVPNIINRAPDSFATSWITSKILPSRATWSISIEYLFLISSPISWRFSIMASSPRFSFFNCALVSRLITWRSLTLKPVTTAIFAACSMAFWQVSEKSVGTRMRSFNCKGILLDFSVN